MPNTQGGLTPEKMGRRRFGAQLAANGMLDQFDSPRVMQAMNINDARRQAAGRDPRGTPRNPLADLLGPRKPNLGVIA